MDSHHQEVVIKVNIPVPHGTENGGAVHQQDGHFVHPHQQDNHHHELLENKTRPPQVRDLVVDEVISQRRKSIHEEVGALHGNVKFDKRSGELKEHLKLEEHEKHRPQHRDSGADAHFEDHREEEMRKLEHGHHVTTALESNAFRDHMEDHVAEKGSLGSREASPIHSPVKKHVDNHHNQTAVGMVHRPPSAGSHTSKKSAERVIGEHHNRRGSVSSTENTQTHLPVSPQDHHHREEKISPSRAHMEHKEHKSVEHRFYQAAMNDSEPLKQVNNQQPKMHTTEQTVKVAESTVVVTPRTATNKSQKNTSKGCSIL